jgi:nucleotide-binding universal stress UspA family protein
MFADAAEHRAITAVRDVIPPLPECPHEVLLRRGEVWPELAAVIEARRIEMVVLGKSGEGNGRKADLGSTARQALRHAPCPVLTVGSHASADFLSRPEVREVLCLTELEPGVPAAAAYAISLASKYQAHLSLLHAAAKRNGTPPELLMQRFCGSISCAGLLHRPTAFLKYGPPVERILEAEHERGADLIVLGLQRVNRFTDARAGLGLSGVERIVAKAHCPVLTIAS